LLVVDRRHVMVGSANMDLRSANLNFEIAAVAVDAEPQFAEQVLATLERGCVGFRPLSMQDLPQDPFRRAIDGFVRAAVAVAVARVAGGPVSPLRPVSP
jgi:phosphatidylserine/phosphatidylglycerophosphate/cardiolipin synthase-like enzyme